MERRRIADWLLIAASIVAGASCVFALHAAWQWPLVGDAALMRYVVFLIGAGHVPYRQIVDINLPGSYLVEACAMRLFGAGAVGLRIFDGALCLVACAAAGVLSDRGWRARLCALLMGLLFVLIHLRDGLVQAGERDLVMAVLVLVAYVALLRCQWVGGLVGVLTFEFLIGVTLTIKPTLLPLAALPLLLKFKHGEKLSHSIKTAGLGVAALLFPVFVMLLWLHHLGSLASFVRTLITVDAAHSTLAHETLTAFLAHSVAPIPVVFVLGIVLAFGLRHLDAESRLLLAGAACGLISLVAQMKGFPYQRYPFLLLALVLIARLLARGLNARGFLFAFAGAGVALSGFWFAPTYAETVSTYDDSAPLEETLSSDLTARHSSSGSVQCLDTVGGCVDTLYGLRLLPSTGFLYDCYAYQGSDQALYRSSFLAALTLARPRTIILTDQVCLESQHSFARIERWPELSSLLAQNYRLDGGWQPGGTMRWWNQRERPPGYEIFTLK